MLVKMGVASERCATRKELPDAAIDSYTAYMESLGHDDLMALLNFIEGMGEMEWAPLLLRGTLIHAKMHLLGLVLEDDE